MPYSIHEFRRLTMLLLQLNSDQPADRYEFGDYYYDSPTITPDEVEQDYRHSTHLDEAINLVLHTLDISPEGQEEMIHHRFTHDQWWQSNQRSSTRQRNFFYYQQLAANLLALEQQQRDEEAIAQWETHGATDCIVALTLSIARFKIKLLPEPDIPESPDPARTRHAHVAANIRQASLRQAIIPQAVKFLDNGNTIAFNDLYNLVSELRPAHDRVSFEREFGIRSFDLVASQIAGALNMSNIYAQPDYPVTEPPLTRYSDLEQGLNLVLQSTTAETPWIDHWPNRFTDVADLPF